MPERRFALIIANGDYDEHKGFKPLKAPAGDARLMADVLADPKIGNFQVQLLIDADRLAVETALEDFFCGEDRQSDDLILLYFSGHGLKHIPLGNKLFFAVKNSNKSSPISTAVSASTLNDMMKSSPVQKQVLLLDCCYSGAFTRELTKKGNAEVNIRDYFEEGRGKFILSASGAIEEAHEVDRQGENISIFTEVLAEGLRSGKADLDGDGEISFEDLCGYADINVPARKPGQNPQHQTMEARNKIWIAHNPKPKQRLPNYIEDMLAGNNPQERIFAIQRIIDLKASSLDSAIAAQFRYDELLARQDGDLLALLAQQKQVQKTGVDIDKPSSDITIQRPSPPLSIPTKPAIEISGMKFIRIPAGKFLMGSTRGTQYANDNEWPQFELEIPYDYWIGRYPITNAQYARFAGKGFKLPEGKENHPVGKVFWNDAIRFVEWLNQTYGLQLPDGLHFAIPSEAEWEKAARGVSGNEWPWGNEFESSLCNTWESQKWDTTPIGFYSPHGDSPFGCADMAGNVWEWTCSIYKPYPYDPISNNEELSIDAERIIRGGSFHYNLRRARCSFRMGYHGNDNGFGLRIIITPNFHFQSLEKTEKSQVVAGSIPVNKFTLKEVENNLEKIATVSQIGLENSVKSPQIESTQPHVSSTSLPPRPIIEVFGGMDFVKIPAGKFLLGSTKENKSAYNDERPQFKMEIPYDYWIGRYPVTNAWYAPFAGTTFKIPAGKENHPVVNVTWYDALKFIEWFNQKQASRLPSGLHFALPSEAEWEKAARGVSGNEWPWGNEFDPALCNTNEGKKGGTTQAGTYSPQGDSPFGCADTAGNVWEWTCSVYRPYPYNSADGREDFNRTDNRVVRGGSWFDNGLSARCSYRSGLNPDYWHDFIGFRCVLSPRS